MRTYITFLGIKFNGRRIYRSSILQTQQTKTINMSKLSKRKVALYKHLLHNGKLSIKNAFFDFGISNIAREVRRLIEIPLDIELKRVKKVGTTKDGEPCYWFEYSATDLNKIALKKALESETYNIHTVSKKTAKQC